MSLKLNFKYNSKVRDMSRGGKADFESEYLIPNLIAREGNDIKLLLDV